MLRALRERRVSAVELLDLHLRRIERYNPALNAIVTPNYEQARDAAAAADAARARGQEAALLGLPLTIKDSIDVAGLLGTAGIVDAAERRPQADARIVASIRGAGA
jgi:amidase